ncbi:LysE family translocator [Pseudonocardia sp. ICBG1293]|uniref:LysE family translocator n=1 Tax=Pseudonocardia sp. ICBG1293 TaxID=2844382 RepID=UPI001CCA0BFF
MVPLLVTWALVVASPGPNFVNTIYFAGGHSVGAGVRVAVGVAIGTAIWATAANTVLASLFSAAPWLVPTLRAAGVGFLAFLAFRILRSALHSRPDPEPGPEAESGKPPGSTGRPLITGLLSDLANPKAAIFWSGVMVTTLPVTASTAMRTAAIIFVTAIAFTWYAFVAVTFRASSVRRIYRKNERTVNIAAGIALALLAVGIAIT